MGVMERESVRRDFGSGRSRCVVSTTALGLGVNLPATHVIVRDVYFPGVGSLSVADLLQMMGRAGRGNRVGRAVAVVRQGDPRDASELQRKLSEESLPELVSHFERPAAHRSRKESAANVTIVATHVASYLSHRREMRGTVEELTEFFGRSLGGRELVRCVPAALQWLTDPARVLAYQDEGGRYALTTLGRNAVKATLPLDLASGFAQLIRDLLSLDPSDRLLAGWQPLDHLIVLELLFQRTPELRRFSEILARQLDRDNHLRTSLLHREWISGSFDHSRAAEVLGSLGIQPPTPVTNDAWARKRAYSAVFRATLLFERMNGTPISEVGERWKVSGLGGVEERWRDDFSWLLSAVAEMLDLRCFYFHLREECGSDPERSMRVKRILLHMRTQTFDLRKCLGYCSPLGPVLRALRTNRPGTARSRSVGIRSIRKLEDAGIRNLEDLEALEVDDLIRLGVHGDLAEQIHSYTSGLLRDKLMPNASDHTATKA